jgi:glutathione S-transferase
MEPPMTNLTLYTHPVSRGRVARWMLEEIGRPYQTVILGFEAMAQPAYRRINPIGKVPVLTHDGTVVTETAAICAYLAESYPEVGLAPTAEERAHYYRWLLFMAGPGEAAVVDRAMGVTPTAEQRRFVGYGDFGAMMMMLETATTQHLYIAGDRFTAADVYVGGLLLAGTALGSIPDSASFANYKDRIATRPAYLRAKALDDELVAEGYPKSNDDWLLRTT